MTGQLKPVGYYCDHSDEPIDARTHHDWEFVEGEGFVFQHQPNTITALCHTGRTYLKPENREQRCARAVPVYPGLAVDAELDRVRAERDEAFRCRDAAFRALQRDDVETDVHLPDLLADGLHGLAEWDTEPPDQAPDWLVNAIVGLVRPVLAKATEQRDRARGIAVALEQENARLEDELAEEKADRNPRLRCLLVKAAKDRDMYVGWSNVCEMPAGLWTRAEALAYGFPRSRLDRADENGSSDLSCGDGHWGDAGFIAEQRGWLRRDRLGDYAQLWLADRQGEAFDLLEPFEDESEVRR